ncbi:MAG: GNAT family N-acetyltransferase [Alphaproteobacteria bacterium]|nr:GNAT family N-acetyltransferase [Alphaproteobacteria bacterium]MBU2083606.1 GNAT family N-acetyltransferase [Alphaproteobacteria bacterium]MBU2143251.1 GNAT family N-acetyltransferase [Alphaproteobacteria bacterium]MBU2195072.1 GNAT family N-acetyltransferase [Alphaproteobacteria bacterium]
MIRPYTYHDADAVVSIWRAASERAHPFLSVPFLDAEAENVRNVYPQFADIWVLEDDGEPIGFIALLEAEVGAIFLQPEHHGKGHGRAMMDFAVAKRGAVRLDVFKANAIGRAFYDRYGFRQVGEYVHEASGQETLKLAFKPTDG